MPIEQIITSYGAIGVFVGTFFEGEAIVILAAFAAHQGYLPLWEVIAAAFTGACLGDQFYFYLGRHQGMAFLARRPAWKGRVDKATPADRPVSCLDHPGHSLFVRTALGAVLYDRDEPYIELDVYRSECRRGGHLGGADQPRGYYLGRTMEVVLADAKKYELAAAGLIILAGGIVWGVRRYRQRGR